MTKCNHCKMDLSIRNPSGYCDHLYYPDNCEVCKKMNKETEIKKLIKEKDNNLHVTEFWSSTILVDWVNEHNDIDIVSITYNGRAMSIERYLLFFRFKN